MKNEILLNLIGTIDWLTFSFMIFWAGVGIATLRIIDAMTRNPTSMTSPVHFSFAYFIRDNFWKFVGEWFLAFIVIRFAQYYIGEKATVYSAFGIGLVARWLPLYLGKAIRALRDKMGISDGQ